ncbi:MAG: efflux RND transporter periplasmic adaptor subunit [Herpetosiphonaceae bacterium]|nr:efflux RND transporter periplasmic adaptor subunit [Herpetosiphonaceae bacterium]
MRRKIIVPLVVLIIVAVAGIVYYRQSAAAANGTSILSGTIEVTETNLATQVGGRVTFVYVSEGDPIHKDEPLARIYSETTLANEKITSPIDGVVLERLVEPGEIAPPGSTVLVVAPVDQLTLKIYVPENQYGHIALGQTYPVTVDSFPGQTFDGRVSYIATQAEFTPRNVQTKDSRQLTVYAVKLALAPTDGKLKAGMPADVHFTAQQ